MLNHVSMPHAALWVVQQARRSQGRDSRRGFNAARGFVGGAAGKSTWLREHHCGFNAARGFVGGAAASGMEWFTRINPVSMPHAALWVVQLRRSQLLSP